MRSGLVLPDAASNVESGDRVECLQLENEVADDDEEGAGEAGDDVNNGEEIDGEEDDEEEDDELMDEEDVMGEDDEDDEGEGEDELFDEEDEEYALGTDIASHSF